MDWRLSLQGKIAHLPSSHIASPCVKGYNSIVAEENFIQLPVLSVVIKLYIIVIHVHMIYHF